MLESIKEDYILSNKKSWDEVAPRFFGRTALPVYGSFAPLDFIQGMLGHEKASTTQIYAQLRGERRRELYRRYF